MFSLLYEEYMYLIFIFIFGEIFYFSVINRDIFFKSIRPKLSDIYRKSVHILGATGFYFGPKVIVRICFLSLLYSSFFSWFYVYLSEVTQIAFLSAEYVLLKTKIPLNLWATGPLKISFLYKTTSVYLSALQNILQKKRMSVYLGHIYNI